MYVKCRTVLLMIGCLMVLFLPTVSAQPVIENLTVSITSAVMPPPKVAKRMSESISMVGQQILLGKSVDDVASHHESYEKVIREVFERVLVGYSVNSVTITADSDTKVQVDLEPWGDVVRQVKVETEFIGLSPEMSAYAASELSLSTQQLNDTLQGLPVEAVDWAASLLKEHLRDEIADKLPEFRPTFEVTAGPVTTVRLSLSPIGPVVQSGNVSIRSQSMPNLFLMGARSPLENFADELRGLPVAFVERHHDFFEKKMQNLVEKLPLTQRYGLTYQSHIAAAEMTDVILRAETPKYRFFVEGYLDMGRQQNNTSARMHLGEWLDPRDELFVETNFTTGTMRWDFDPGYTYRFTKQTLGGVKYNLNDHLYHLFIEQYLGHGYSLRLERVPSTDYNEVGLRYKIHEFLSAEYVVNSKESYLRLVGSL